MTVEHQRLRAMLRHRTAPAVGFARTITSNNGEQREHQQRLVIARSADGRRERTSI